MSKIFLATIILFLFSNNLQAQRPGGWQGKALSIGHLYGKVKDSHTKSAVSYASVTLLAFRKDSLITGAMVEDNGDFSLDKVPFGHYRMRVQFIGYTTLFKEVTISPDNFEQDLGDIKLESSSRALKGVTVEAEKSAVEMNIDRKVYNVDKDISSKGGNGIDVMKNVPGVSIDATGNVTLRNNTPMIFVDGRPTTLTLDQIPADQIDRVEVITNPSAKYDAGATGGILNVVMKRNNKPGYNGMINAGVGTNNRYNLNTSLNIKEKKINFFISYNLNTRGNLNDGYTNKDNLSNYVYTGYYNQKDEATVFNTQNFGRIGFDYYLSNRNTITFSQNVMVGDFHTLDNQNYKFGDSLKHETSHGPRVNDTHNYMQNYTSQISFKHTFPQAGREFTSDIMYNYMQNNNVATYTTNTITDSNNATLAPIIQTTSGYAFSHSINFQMDYVYPFIDSTKLEVGMKSNYSEYIASQNVNFYNSSTGEYINDPNLSSVYQINNFINAAYVNYVGKLDWFNYQVGLRVEQTHFNAVLNNKSDSAIDYYYPDGTKNLDKILFPSLFISKKLGKYDEFQINFSRKINRAGWRQLMPFKVMIDKQNYSEGNPALGPEFQNLFETNYDHIFKYGNFLSSAYMKIAQNVITNVILPSPADPTILDNTYINGNTSYTYGWENTLKYTFFKKKFDVTLDGNIFYTDIQAPILGANLENKGWSWFAKTVLSYKLPMGFTVQVNGNYEAPKIIPQGKTLDMYFMDFAINKDINKMMSCNFTISDVFDTKHYGQVYETSAFDQSLSRRWESRYFKLGFIWRFGEVDVSLFRKRNQKKNTDQNNQEQDY